MKAAKKFDGKINSITASRWAAYTAAAAASGFAATHTAEAAIHYSGLVNQRITDDQAVIFPLDPAGGSFLARHRDCFYSGHHRCGGTAYFNIYGAKSASVIGTYSPLAPIVFPFKLNPGETISAGHFTSQHRSTFDLVLALDYLYTSHGFDSQFGYFLKRGYGLVGFKFNNGAGDQYGWVRLKMRGGLINTFAVVDYAYGDPGDVIKAGQKTGSAPELESVGGLALGATGLLAWRRRRSAP
ncbi:MAG TPA: hypothetical protein VGI60_14990 [Chthoniobacterales bacterium]|jgi:hypothetical protein